MPLNLASASNVVIPAYLVLLSKGYRVSCKREEDPELWIAERDDLRFVGHDPLDLLGVVAVYEGRGAHWRASDEEIEAFTKRFLSEQR